MAQNFISQRSLDESAANLQVAQAKLALAGAVVVSGFVALTLTPMLCAQLLWHNPKPNRFDRTMERLLTSASNRYGALPHWIVTARY